MGGHGEEEGEEGNGEGEVSDPIAGAHGRFLF